MLALIYLSFFLWLFGNCYYNRLSSICSCFYHSYHTIHSLVKKFHLLLNLKVIMLLFEAFINKISCLKVPCSTKLAKAKKAPEANNANTSISGNFLPASSNGKTSTTVPVPCKVTSLPRSDENVKTSAPSIAAAVSVSCSMDVSPSKSDANSVSMDESMSVCDSFKSPEVEYLDNNDVPPLDSIDRKTFRNLYISDHTERTGTLH